MSPSTRTTSSPSAGGTDPTAVIRPPSTATSPGQRAPRNTNRLIGAPPWGSPNPSGGSRRARRLLGVGGAGVVVAQGRDQQGQADQGGGQQPAPDPGHGRPQGGRGRPGPQVAEPGPARHDHDEHPLHAPAHLVGSIGLEDRLAVDG